MIIAWAECGSGAPTCSLQSPCVRQMKKPRPIADDNANSKSLLYSWSSKSPVITIEINKLSYNQVEGESVCVEVWVRVEAVNSSTK
jgi:hypothetical protein